MSEVHNDIAYGLGKRAYKAGLSGLPMDDELFAQYIEDNDTVPLVPAIQAYTEGWYEGYNKKEAEEKVIQFPGAKS